jgi:hypothetical protein
MENMLHKLSKFFVSGIVLSTIALSLTATQAKASEVITINATKKAPLFDGSCNKDEWKSAIKFELPAQTSVYLMHDNDSLYVCAKGKAEDYAVIDVYTRST